MNNNIIPGGSTIHFKTVGSSITEETAIVEYDTEVLADAFMMINNAPFCTTCDPVEKINEEEYVVRLWLQDTMLIYDGVFYNSTNDL